jgi:hypothetical protein
VFKYKLAWKWFREIVEKQIGLLYIEGKGKNTIHGNTAKETWK